MLLKDFNITFAIVSSLHFCPVSRLKKTWKVS